MMVIQSHQKTTLAIKIYSSTSNYGLSAGERICETQALNFSTVEEDTSVQEGKCYTIVGTSKWQVRKEISNLFSQQKMEQLYTRPQSKSIVPES